jgi:hypothetical protein
MGKPSFYRKADAKKIPKIPRLRHLLETLQCALLTFQLYDALQGWHGFPSRTRELLESAALRYDIGWIFVLILISYRALFSGRQTICKLATLVSGKPIE